MPIGSRVKDQVLAERVSRQLTKRGIRMPCRVNVSVRNGEVTLSGEIQYELQRKTAIHAAREVDGVFRVRDQLRVRSATAGWLKQKYGSGHA